MLQGLQTASFGLILYFRRLSNLTLHSKPLLALGMATVQYSALWVHIITAVR